jgi:hypothetical protein
MAATIARPARLIALNANEDSALAALLYALRSPETVKQLNLLGAGLGVNQVEEIAGLWDQVYGRKSIEA